MHSLVCPHCKSHRIVATNIPKDVVVVMPCPSCGELTVLFRDKAIALNRRILEHGSREERIEHCSRVITEFLEAGMFFPEANADPAPQDAESEGGREDEQEQEQEQERETEPVQRRRPRPPRVRRTRGISQEEIDHFVRVELAQLDDPAYFRKHFK